MDYEVALHSLQAVTGASYKLFQGQIESIAKKTNKSAIDVAGSFEVIGSAMSQYLQNPKALGQISEAGITLAKASRQELVPTLEDLTGIMNQFKLEAGDAYNAINRLTAGEIVGTMRTSEVAKSLTEFGAGAKLANVNLGESVALVEVLGRQMEHSMVGNAAKNIMIIMDSAKGLAKRARKELTKNGVNMDTLMNHSLPLGARLKELSKILNDSVAMTKVFGRENKTAGQIILSNLKTYNDWEKQIQSTNKAQEQAAVNSDTVASKWDQLKNSFINTIVTGDKLNTSMARLKGVMGFVTDHMGTILKVGVDILLFFAAWKTMIWLAEAALAGYNIVLGITGALTGVCSVAIGRSTIALTAYRIATGLATAAQWLLNVAMDANPIGLIIIAIAALSVGVYEMTNHWNEWGAALSTTVPGLGMIISLIMSFRRNWDMIKKSFKDGGIIAGLKAIGAVLVDALIQPFEQLFSLINKFTGFKWAANVAAGIHLFRQGLGVDTGDGKPAAKPALLSPQVQATEVTKNNNTRNTLDINFNDPHSLVKSTQMNGGGPGIPVKIGSTTGVK
jgi:TP901 family phage tail tape measure protein